MALTWYRLKKWTKMAFGRSNLHVKQREGQHYSFDSIQGYYNDFSLKLLKDKKNFKRETVPVYPNEDGVIEEFSIGVFQYGLGAYDLYLSTKEDKYYQKFLLCLKWAIDKQNEDGGYDTFNVDKYRKSKYSALAQSEAASLLFRGWVVLKNEKYLTAAKRAISFMLLPEEKGGCTKYEKDNVFIMEYPHAGCVLNGWIFSIFGLIDYTIVFPDDIKVKKALDDSIKTLENSLNLFKEKHWSYYDLSKRIASPFYQSLHIELLSVLEKYTHSKVFADFKASLIKEKKNPFLKTRAVNKKFWQKLRD